MDAHLFEVCLGFIINFLETIIVFFLLSSKLTLKKSNTRILFCFFLDFIAIDIFNLYISDSNIQMVLILLVDILSALLISTSPVSLKFFWGSVYTIIALIADNLTFLLGGIFTNYTASERLYQYPISSILSFVYIFICFCFVYILTRKKDTTFALPWYLQIVSFALVILGIVSIERMLDLLLYLDSASSYAENIIFVCTTIILIIVSISFLLFRTLGSLYQKNMELTAENQQKQFEEQQYELLSNANQILRTWKHDFHNYIATLQVMTDANDISGIAEYLQQINHELNKTVWQVRTGNSIVDAVLTSKLSPIKQYEIEFTHSIFLPEQIPLTSLALTSLLGNLLDNAIEACEKLDEQNGTDQKYIKLEIRPYNQFLFIDIRNSTITHHHIPENLYSLLTTPKGEGHGIGLKRIKSIVAQANGFLTIEPKENEFLINILIPLQNEEAQHAD